MKLLILHWCCNCRDRPLRERLGIKRGWHNRISAKIFINRMHWLEIKKTNWKLVGSLLPSSMTIIVTLLFLTGFATTFKHHVDYAGENLKFVVFSNPPFDVFVRGPNGTFTFTGVALNVVQWMAAYYNFTYTLVAVNQTFVEKYGMHEASFYQLINDKDIDGISCAFFLTQDRINRMDYTSYFVWVDGLSLIVPKPGEESRLFAFTGPFQPKVWLCILITIIFMVGVMTVFTLFYKNPIFTTTNTEEENLKMKQKTSSNLSSYMIYIINIMTNQGGREAFQRNSFRILVGFWLLGAMVLVNSYSSIVISSLTVPKMIPPIGTLDDLAASKDVEIIVRHDTLIGEQILQATNGVYKVLGDQARLHPSHILGDPFKVNALLVTRKYAFPFIQAFNSWFVAQQYKKDGQCRFHATKPLPVPLGYYSWLVKKGSKNANLFNPGLVQLWDSGLTYFWANKGIGKDKATECFDTKRQKNSAKQVPLRLVDLTSAFLILGIGLGLATISFLQELIKSKVHQRRPRLISTN